MSYQLYDSKALHYMKKRNKNSKPKMMFPDSRGVLLVFSPILASFFVGFAYIAHQWHPRSLGDTIGKIIFLEIIFSFIGLCLVGFLAGIAGPHRMEHAIVHFGGRAALGGIILIVGSIFVLLYYGFKV